jgi:hypothetical protein
LTVIALLAPLLLIAIPIYLMNAWYSRLGTVAEQGAERGTEIVPAEVDLSRAGLEQGRRTARLLRAVVAAEAAARGQEAPEFRRNPLKSWTV